MNYEQIQRLEKETKQVHADLADVLVSITIIRQSFAAWPPERRAQYEAQWKNVYAKAVENLDACFTILDTP
ncbi:MAG: hypothetical protein NT075_19275 [Chloroflexi bacterium]|nr:hypothetical protein [Chloroflexota bacterium]